MIYGTRVRAAREFREMQQGRLAQLLDISPGRLSQIEAAEMMQLDDDKLEVLSAHLRMPKSFFARPPVPGLSEGSMRFRAQVKVSKRVRSAARREADLGLEIFSQLLDRVDFPAATIPTLPGETDIEIAAEHVRAALGVAPDVVIPKVVRLVEAAGVVVLSVTHDDPALSGFSTWWGPRQQYPVVAISDHLSWDRYRHTVLHEVAHLILHRGGGLEGMDGRAIERAADQFASAFLLPRDVALEELPRPLTLGQLIPLKQKWGMSIQSLLMRASSVGVINDRQKTSLWKQLSARRWRTEEPLAFARPREQPRGLSKMVEVAYGAPPDLSRLARDLGRYRVDVEADLARYAAPRRAPHALESSPGKVISIDKNRSRRG